MVRPTQGKRVITRGWSAALERAGHHVQVLNQATLRTEPARTLPAPLPAPRQRLRQGQMAPLPQRLLQQPPSQAPAAALHAQPAEHRLTCHPSKVYASSLAGSPCCTQSHDNASSSHGLAQTISGTGTIKHIIKAINPMLLGRRPQLKSYSTMWSPL